jgi:hypothetical protein
MAGYYEIAVLLVYDFCPIDALQPKPYFLSHGAHDMH